MVIIVKHPTTPPPPHPIPIPGTSSYRLGKVRFFLLTRFVIPPRCCWHRRKKAGVKYISRQFFENVTVKKAKKNNLNRMTYEKKIMSKTMFCWLYLLYDAIFIRRMLKQNYIQIWEVSEDGYETGGHSRGQNQRRPQHLPVLLYHSPGTGTYQCSYTIPQVAAPTCDPIPLPWKAYLYQCSYTIPQVRVPTSAPIPFPR